MMILIVILTLGLTSYSNLSRDSMPPFTIRIATIVTQFPGASPERVEQLITKQIEEVNRGTCQQQHHRHPKD